MPPEETTHENGLPKVDAIARRYPRIAMVITVISTVVTIALSIGNYLLKQSVEETDRELKRRAQQLEESKERTSRYDFVYKTLSAVDAVSDRQRTLAINISRLALDHKEQETLFSGLVFAADRGLAETGREAIAAVGQHPTDVGGQEAQSLSTDADRKARKPTIKFPVYVTPDMVASCITRGGSDKCTQPGLTVTLGGKQYSRGIVFTQSFPNTALATIKIPKGARSAIVGNYWLGTDCGGQKPMLMYVFIDSQKVWEADTAQIYATPPFSIPPGAKNIVLRGASGDGDARCDDSVWVDAHFNS